MKDKKIIISLVGILIMLLLIISATYAYFSVTVTGNGSKTMITANTPKKHSLSVSTLYDDIHIHVDNEDMKLANVGSYYGAVDKDNRYEKTKEEGAHNIIEVSSRGMENIRYSCSGDIKVTLNIDNGSMGSVLEKEDVLLYLKGLGLDETLDLSILKINNTKMYNTSFEIDGDSSDYLSAIVELINKESYQNYIANKMLNVSIEADNMVCRENGTYKYLVKLNKNIKEKQNGKETSKTVSIFYDDEGIYQKIQNIYLVDYINTSKAIKTWELGDTERGTKLDEVLGWLKATPDIEDSYDLYIGANGPMQAPKDMSYAFYNFINLKKITGDVLDTSEVTNMSYLFRQNTNLTDISALSNWDVSKVTNMSYLFSESGISDLNPLLRWNTKNVTRMDSTFSSCRNLNDLTSLINWSTSNVTTFNEMFNYTKISDLGPLTNWDVSKATSIRWMFRDTLIDDLTSISNWDVSHVQRMDATFSITDIIDLTPLKDCDVSRVINMGNLFYSCKKLTNLIPIANWDVSSVTDMQSMFQNSSINDLTPLKDWDVSSVKTTSQMFRDTLVKDLSPLSGWNVSKVTSMSMMFFNSTSINDIIPLKDWNVSNVTNIKEMFYGTKLIDLSPISDWNTSNVTNMAGVFSGTLISDLTPIKNWQTSKVTTLATMFSGTKLTDLTPISDWNTSSVTSMSGLFASTLISDLGPIANWDVSNVTGMSYMFKNCKNLTDISPITGWDVSKVTGLGDWYSGGMFQGCTGLEKVDLSNWKVSKLETLFLMFGGCTKLSELKLPKALYNNIKELSKYQAMFGGKADGYYGGVKGTFPTVSPNITVYTESSQVDWVKARLQEALGENNNSTVLTYE